MIWIFRIFLLLLLFVLYQFAFCALGLILWHCKLKNVGHYFMCISSLPILRSKLPDYCPFKCEKCDTCRRWTCPYWRTNPSERSTKE